MNDCIFCKIVAGEIPCYKIYEDQNVLAFLDISCDAVGHTLVVPKKHCDNVITADGKNLSAVINAVSKISKHFVEDCGFEGVNIFNNCGKTAGQTIMHLHFHIIPRKNGDGIEGCTANRKIEMDLADICAKLTMLK